MFYVDLFIRLHEDSDYNSSEWLICCLSHVYSQKLQVMKFCMFLYFGSCHLEMMAILILNFSKLNILAPKVQFHPTLDHCPMEVTSLLLCIIEYQLIAW